jgi:hypothetical protein
MKPVERLRNKKKEYPKDKINGLKLIIKRKLLQTFTGAQINLRKGTNL